MSVSVRITPREKQAIYRLVETGVFMNPTDLVRTAIRELLEKFPSAKEASKRTVVTHETRSQEEKN